MPEVGSLLDYQGIKIWFQELMSRLSNFSLLSFAQYSLSWMQVVY